MECYTKRGFDITFRWLLIRIQRVLKQGMLRMQEELRPVGICVKSLSLESPLGQLVGKEKPLH
jgi:hypothetical protein